MTQKNHVLESVRGDLSFKELLRIDPETKERFTKPLYTFDELIYRFYVPVKFFQDNGLLTRKLVDGPESITEDFEWRSSDLTELGRLMFKTGHQAWLRALDRKGHKGVDAADAEQIRRNGFVRQKPIKSTKIISRS